MASLEQDVKNVASTVEKDAVEVFDTVKADAEKLLGQGKTDAETEVKDLESGNLTGALTDAETYVKQLEAQAESDAVDVGAQVASDFAGLNSHVKEARYQEALKQENLAAQDLYVKRQRYMMERPNTTVTDLTDAENRKDRFGKIIKAMETEMAVNPHAKQDFHGGPTSSLNDRNP